MSNSGEETQLSHFAEEDKPLLPVDIKVIKVEKSAHVGASRKSVFFNVCNTSMGASILALPFAFQAMGLIQGLILLFIFAVISLVGLDMLPLSAEAVGAKSYESMITGCYGRAMTIIFQICVIFYSIGVAIGFVVITGDLIPPIVSSWTGNSFPNDIWYLQPWFIELIITTLVLFPLASLRTLDSVKIASMCAISAVLYFTVIVVIESAFDLDQWQEEGIVEHTGMDLFSSIEWWKVSYDVFLGIPIMAFAFGGHSQAIFLFSEMHPKHRSLDQWNLVAATGYTFLYAIYVIVAVLSNLRFLPGDSSNLLKQMLRINPNNAVLQIAAIAMSINIILAFPLFTFPVRFSIDRLVFPCLVSVYDATPAGAVWHRYLRYWALTFFIVYLCYIVAATVGKIDLVFGLVGAIGGTLIKFTFPTLCYMKVGSIYRERFTNYDPKLPWSHWIGSILLLVISGAAGLISAFLVLLRAYQARTVS